MAFLLPLVRFINTKVFTNLIKRVCPDDNVTANVYSSIVINGNYTMFISVKIGSTANQMTSYLTLFVEVLLNVYDCIMIIRLGNRIDTDSPLRHELKLERDEAIVRLVSTEILETLVPFIYGITFLIAYYGPNANILGNIKNSYWQYEAVENATALLENVSKMVVIDVSGSILVGFLLWKYSKINLFKESCKMMKSFFLLFVIRIGIILAKVNTTSNVY